MYILLSLLLHMPSELMVTSDHRVRSGFFIYINQRLLDVIDANFYGSRHLETLGIKKIGYKGSMGQRITETTQDTYTYLPNKTYYAAVGTRIRLNATVGPQHLSLVS